MKFLEKCRPLAFSYSFDRGLPSLDLVSVCFFLFLVVDRWFRFSNHLAKPPNVFVSAKKKIGKRFNLLRN